MLNDADVANNLAHGGLAKSRQLGHIVTPSPGTMELPGKTGVYGNIDHPALNALNKSRQFKNFAQTAKGNGTKSGLENHAAIVQSVTTRGSSGVQL
jgi:hypothetical protein